MTIAVDLEAKQQTKNQEHVEGTSVKATWAGLGVLNSFYLPILNP